jgi:F-type H+-transporting ATPase subunit g
MSSSLRATQALRATRVARAPATRRFASTQQASEAAKAGAEKAQAAAGDVQKKAVDYAQVALQYGQKALDASKKALGPLGERVGNALGGEWPSPRLFLSFILLLFAPFHVYLTLHSRRVYADSLFLGYREPILYNLAVVRELAKQVYVTERLAPPTSFNTVANAYSTLWSRASNPAYWKEIARNGEWKKVAVYGAEAYGIYKVCSTFLEAWIDHSWSYTGWRDHWSSFAHWL